MFITKMISLLDICPSGTQLASGGVCENCTQGTYRTAGINDVCEQCPSGNSTSKLEGATSTFDCDICE